MPNHVTNIVHAPAHVIRAFAPDGIADFNAIIPMPSPFRSDYESGAGVMVGPENRAKLAAGLFNDPRDGGFDETIFRLSISDAWTPASKEVLALTIEALQNILDYGSTDFLEWARANWGTKWGAYNADHKRGSETSVHFETAWSMPEPVAKALSAMFPQDEIVWEYADENTGSNCGTIRLFGGEVTSSEVSPRYDERTDEERRKWNLFSLRLRYPGKSLQELGYDEDGNCIDEDEE